MSYYAIGALITFISTTSLIFIILFLDWRKKTNVTYCLINVSIAFWSYFYIYWQLSNDYNAAFKYLKLLMYGATFMPIFLFHFIVVYLNEEKKKRAILAIVYLIGIFLLICIYNNLLFNSLSPKQGFPFWPNAGIVMPLYLLFFFGIIAYAMIMLFKEYQVSRGNRRTRTGYLLIALAIAILSGSPNYALWYNIPIPPILNPYFAVYIILIAYAITKHKLMDITLVIRKATAWALTILLLGGIYIVLVYLYRSIIGPTINLPFILLSLLYGILVGETFQKIRLFFQTTADKAFVKGWYDYRKVQRKIATDLRKTVSLDDAVKAIRKNLDEELDIAKVSILLPDAGNKNYQGDGINMAMNDPLIEKIREEKDLLPKEEYAALPAELCVPCFSGEELSALILLGKKRSEDPFNEQDYDILKTLSDDISDTFLRIKPYEEVKKDFESTQKKLVDVQVQLERSQRLASLGTIAAGVAHEIRNPLGMIELEVANMTPEKMANQESLLKCKQDVTQNIQRITNIVRNMLSLPRSEKKERSEVNINEVIENTLQFFAINRIKLTKELGQLAKIAGNREELKQVFINLIDNATQAMPEGGELKIKTYSAENKVMVEVSDSGVGIAEEDIPRIFDPFFSTYHENAGLGLSIVYRIVREHDGEISVRSEKGKGSTFTLSFPIKV